MHYLGHVKNFDDYDDDDDDDDDDDEDNRYTGCTTEVQTIRPICFLRFL